MCGKSGLVYIPEKNILVLIHHTLNTGRNLNNIVEDLPFTGFFSKYILTTAQSQYQMESAFFLNVVVGKGSAVF